jgi:hypothetical protein
MHTSKHGAGPKWPARFDNIPNISGISNGRTSFEHNFCPLGKP